MIPNATSNRQPVIGKAYSASHFAEGSVEPTQVTIVYRGYENGKSLVTDGRRFYYADLSISEDQEEPAFSFQEEDVIKRD